MVCNTLVVVAFFYRTFRQGEDIESYEDDDETAARDAAPQTQTRPTYPPSLVLTEISDMHTSDLGDYPTGMSLERPDAAKTASRHREGY